MCYEDPLDRDGYPTQYSKSVIDEWDCLVKDPFGLMDFVQSLWMYDDFFNVEESSYSKNVRLYSISTGGWSGNETLISWLQDTKHGVFWALHFVIHIRGGHYGLLVSKMGKEEYTIDQQRIDTSRLILNVSNSFIA